MEYLFRAQVTPGWNVLLGLPNKLQNRERIQKSAPLTVPSVTASVSGPYFSFNVPNFSAISSNACSQVIRCHFPSPLSPALLSGYLSCSGWYSHLMVYGILWHTKPRLMGCSLLPSILIGRPSLTCTSTPQLPAQNVQIDLFISVLLMIPDSISTLIWDSKFINYGAFCIGLLEFNLYPGDMSIII